ncbi:dihydroorotase [Priestia endophytica]|uniref:dihydroorotase n=1 Tax=Priestia endophytica TaxID=135735 RepID=UPI00227EF04D|nr:dihydroorotase [Priestia endophytica]MCY8232679.1 dihydroorotase [Priestia endophytica]
MQLLIKNVKVLTNNGQLEEKEVLIEENKIVKVSKNISSEAAEIIDGKGQLLLPGFIDAHIHLREPGGEHKETIETGTLAAARGGFTTVAAMPNTRPVPDTKEGMTWLVNRIEEKGHVRVLPYGSITIRQAGKELTDFEGLKEAGAFALTDDGVGVQSAGMMYEAMKKAAALNIPIVAHCEDNTLIYKGSVHDGKYSREQGLNGIPSVCEAVHIARDVLLAEAAGCHYHVCHVSTKESVRVIRDAKKAGINVTAEVTPHHLLLSEDDIKGQDTSFKMNPPLRAKEDQQALIEGLLDGTIDFIATDHAPHTEEEKSVGMERAPFGIVGLETAFPLLYTNLVEKNVLTLAQLVEFLTEKVASVFNLPYGTLEEGAIADLTLVNLTEEEKIDPNEFLSKGRNTPFKDWTCKGWPVMTIAKGKRVWEKGSVTV